MNLLLIFYFILWILAAQQDVKYLFNKDYRLRLLPVIILWPYYSFRWSAREDYPKSELFWIIKMFCLMPFVLFVVAFLTVLTNGLFLIVILGIWVLMLQEVAKK